MLVAKAARVIGYEEIAKEYEGLSAKPLHEAGGDTTCIRYKGMTHAFIDKLGHVPLQKTYVLK